MAGVDLGCALAAIHHAPQSASERRALVRHAVECALRGVAAPERTVHPIACLEEVLAAVGQGVPKRLTVAEAKRRLREHGDAGLALASRLNRLAKGRNVHAHPDLKLISDVGDLFASADDGSLFSSEEATSGQRDFETSMQLLWPL